jgi:hypothetical protein
VTSGNSIDVKNPFCYHAATVGKKRGGAQMEQSKLVKYFRKGLHDLFFAPEYGRV